MNKYRTDRELALHAGVVVAYLVLGVTIVAVCWLFLGCSGSETIKETRYVESEGLSLGQASVLDGGYATILPYGGYRAIGRDGTILTDSEGGCCGTGITITQTQSNEGEGESEQDQSVIIDQSVGGEGGGMSVMDQFTDGPIPIEAIDGKGGWWMGEAGTHTPGHYTPIHLTNPHGDVITGAMSRRLASGTPIQATYLPGDGGEPEKVTMFRLGAEVNYGMGQ